MLSKKQQNLIEEIERGTFEVVVRAAVQIISDLQITGLTVDDYSESFAGISQYFEAVEGAFLRLSEAEGSAEGLLYQLFYIVRPLHRVFLLGMFGAAVFKGRQDPQFLFTSVRYAVQVTDALQNLFLRYYLQQQLQFYCTLQPVSVGEEEKRRAAEFFPAVAAVMQTNFTCALGQYQSLVKQNPQAQAQNYAFLPASFLNGLGKDAAGPLIQAGLQAECPYFQLEALRFTVQRMPVQVLRERFSQAVQLFTRPMKTQKLEYQAKLLLVAFLGKLNAAYNPAVILYEFIELVDGVLGLDQVLDALQKLIQQEKREEFTLQIAQKTFARLFTRFRAGNYQEYYLLHQFIQQIMATLASKQAYQVIVTELSYVYAFLMGQQNTQQAGRVATRVVSELGKRDNVSLEFYQVVNLAQQVSQTVGKDEFQFPDTVFHIAVLAASSVFDAEFCLISQDVVTVLNALGTPALTQAVLYRLIAAPTEDKAAAMQRIRAFYLSVAGSLDDAQKTALVTDASILFDSLEWADMISPSVVALNYLTGAVLSRGTEKLQGELLAWLDKALGAEDGAGESRVQMLLIQLSARAAQLSNKVSDGEPQSESVRALFSEAETLTEAFGKALTPRQQIDAMMELGWVLRRFYMSEGCPGFGFFTKLVQKARRLLETGAVEDKEERRRAFCLAAALEAQ